jgi:mono/diheme cytochrome c family protein
MKKFLKWVGILLFVIISSLFILIHLRQNRKFEAPYPAIRASGDTALLARGKYLVYGPAHCANCHASPSMEKLVDQGKEVPLAGGQVFDLPIGKIYAKNITPHKTGIGEMTDEEFARALRYGVRKNGKALFDFMPFHNTSDEDIAAILSYLRGQEPIGNAVPENQLNLLGKAVFAFMVKPVGPQGEPPAKVKRDSSAKYGEYLANNVANCRGCHTNRDLMTGAFIGEDYAGGLEMESETDSGTLVITTPNLTPHASGRLKGWTSEQFIQRFRMGKLVAQSHMPWGPFSRMSDEELKAIYNYLQTVKPVDNKVPPAFLRE